ncbi:MAG: 2-isopropylmalate synthase [Deltaproteobacteria bacterium]|nr:2-isopropylmalate synthase [Deltaproteobacteria bacterium]
MDPEGKYAPYLSTFKVENPQRTWPDRTITAAPIWCSVDLRDGNQALVQPMDQRRKLTMWEMLLKLGFKEIEIGFPSAAAVEFSFTRYLIENKLIPEDVTIQALTQARSHLIERTFEALDGAKRAIVHLYNSTSELQRRVVFGKNRSEIIDLMIAGAETIKSLAQKTSTEIMLEYSPESFTGTEMEFAVEICNAVIDVWKPTPDRKIIINLPATVELSTPNIYADQIEIFCRNIKERESIIVSIHTHNDRGTAVAAAELALMAGAERVEGTLLGNGERTGNLDMITLALNLFSQGVDPNLDLRQIKEIRAVVESCTGLSISPRHPYAGDLVFTAFSGSHQDAISKGIRAMQENGTTRWEVPYLPIDPADIGRKYEPLIRINAQSGKGGVAYVMQHEFGYELPKLMHPEFSGIIQSISDKSGAEVTPKQVWDAFYSTYLSVEEPLKFIRFHSEHGRHETDAELVDYDTVKATLVVEFHGYPHTLEGHGNGPVDACKRALENLPGIKFRLVDFAEHSLSAGSDAEAAAYIGIEFDGKPGRIYGVGKHPNTERANILALICAVNRAL